MAQRADILAAPGNWLRRSAATSGSPSDSRGEPGPSDWWLALCQRRALLNYRAAYSVSLAGLSWSRQIDRTRSTGRLCPVCRHGDLPAHRSSRRASVSGGRRRWAGARQAPARRRPPSAERPDIARSPRYAGWRRRPGRQPPGAVDRQSREPAPPDRSGAP